MVDDVDHLLLEAPKSNDPTKCLNCVLIESGAMDGDGNMLDQGKSMCYFCEEAIFQTDQGYWAHEGSNTIECSSIATPSNVGF